MLISASEIITRSVDLYKQNWQGLLQYSALLLIPTVGLIATTALFTPELLVSSELTTFGLPLLWSILLTIAFSLVGMWFSAGLLRTLAALYQSETPDDVRTTILEARHILVPAILSSILTGIFVFLGFLLFIIPGVILSIWYSFVFYEVVLDNKGAKESLTSSKALVVGRWWAVLWRLAAPGLLFGLVIAFIQWIVVLPFTFGDGPVTETIIGILSSITAVIFIPLTSAAPTILYLELKKMAPVSSTPPITASDLEPPTA